MGKIRLTKGELKYQRDCLRQYERYLPTLQLKKQQLQLEILASITHLEEKRNLQKSKAAAILQWAGLLSEPQVELAGWLTPKAVQASTKNIAGVDIPVFTGVEFPPLDYDLFSAPLWFDHAIDSLRALVSLRKEIALIEKGILILRQELRITTQRVNLFEKVKIPQAEEAIRLIRIYIGDQMTNAVGRARIAKAKIESLTQEEVLV